MATLSEEIYDVLLTDAQSAVAGSLGVLLGYNAVTKPRPVYFRNPPEKPDLPLLTYFNSSDVHDSGGTEFNPRALWYTITAWGDNFGTVLKRVFDLLQKKKGLTPTDFDSKRVLFDTAGPVLFDEDWQVYYQANIYRIIAVAL